MKLFQVLTIIALALLTISCASISGGGGDKISELKIPAKQVEAGTCVFGAKTTQHVTNNNQNSTINDNGKTVNQTNIDCNSNNQTTNNTGISLGEYDKTIGYYEQALKSVLATFGEDHPKVATSRNNLGLAWHSKGEYDKAIGYYKQAVNIALKKLGDKHPTTKTIKRNLLSALLKLNN